VSTAAQAIASRTNSLQSTGPKTDAGKAVSRFNPLRHGLTSEHLIIPGENVDDFHALHNDLRSYWQPVGADEEALVSKFAEHEWRLIRARRVETATLHLYMERLLADPESDGDHTRALALVYERYGRELDRLRRYETTITRAHAKLQRELEAVVATRLDQEQEPEPSPAQAAFISSLPGFVSQNKFPEFEGQLNDHPQPLVTAAAPEWSRSSLKDPAPDRRR
jgi:hypothetical protein